MDDKKKFSVEEKKMGMWEDSDLFFKVNLFVVPIAGGLTSLVVGGYRGYQDSQKGICDFSNASTVATNVASIAQAASGGLVGALFGISPYLGGGILLPATIPVGAGLGYGLGKIESLVGYGIGYTAGRLM